VNRICENEVKSVKCWYIRYTCYANRAEMERKFRDCCLQPLELRSKPVLLQAAGCRNDRRRPRCHNHRSPVQRPLDRAVFLRTGRARIAVRNGSADASHLRIPGFVNFTGLELDLHYLATSVIDCRTDDEALPAAIYAMVDGDDVTGRDLLS